ncbi:VOC family protein [Staphylococcus intermedius]|uniref:Putative glyoxalase n=1 Tax=Staphylococcus intermedius NCTC 11048 TaxID=1141106 RepID=A0A380G3V6_STAIN|nr:VOC family protein [Staphylococcus intermedius]PCF63878.1 glyoxalase/bleomycin resistance/extradiol dioxygenase family protein [Staphylococcus intermedius]PCF78593.1 glyoxalase/bleomycin resistance/extradiol dioxygenase family protein [Staphylococcus intermedius]PCF79566.1 glyoxalase/bleomycin resistance/extradiol dioxygenase family protein [Staphylococcus intermedius]PCF86699.1 glyoxalase/bleomycin resistance/extradiol dioxygenase family protein [Staphylococcus intermedius]PCF89776.1 glyox
MIQRLQEVMLYVQDQEIAKQFWTSHFDFQVASDETFQGMRVVTLKPTDAAQTAIVLQDKEKVEAMGMGVNTGTPSLMFGTTDIDALYDDLKSKGVQVGEKMTLPTGIVFNFADDENNYFAVRQIEQ